MATPIYKNEEAWRAFMLLKQSAIISAVNGVGETILIALTIYLISTYSVPAALGLAGAALAGFMWSGRRADQRRMKQLAYLDSDPDLDLDLGL